MSYLIYSDKNKLEYFPITKTLTTIGNGLDFDIFIKVINSSGLSLLKEKDGVKIFKIDESENKNIKGIFNKTIQHPSIIHLTDEQFLVIVPNQELKKATDWNYEKLPKSPYKNSFPEELLKFFTSNISNSKGILFHYKNGMLKTLAHDDITVKDNTEMIISDLLNRNNEETIIEVNGITHSMIFNTNYIDEQFILVRTKLNEAEDEEAILYLSTPDLNEIPKGLLYSLLSFATHSLVAHIIYKEKKHLLKNNISNSDVMIGESLALKRIIDTANKIAKTDLAILIQGETGTGKEVLVQHIYKQSKKPKIVSVNCAALPKDLAESILFGHAKGAFTGATNDQIGKIEEADGGILFLDEIAELSLENQAKLLRVLQDQIVTGIGKKDKKVNIRIISATHQNLLQLIKDQKFREDLYFRLNEARLEIPPLRERKEDIPLLANIFLEETATKNQLTEKFITPEAINTLKKYQWPGNIRELKTIIRRLCILTDNQLITESDIINEIPQNIGLGSDPFNFNNAKKSFIKAHLNKVLKHTGDNKNQAAKLLGITPRSLYRLLADEEFIDDDNIVTETSDKLLKTKDQYLALEL